MTTFIYGLIVLLTTLKAVAIFASNEGVVEVLDDSTTIDLLEGNNTTLQSSEDDRVPYNEAYTKSGEDVNKTVDENKVPEQIGPLIDIFGRQLLSLEMMNDTTAALRPSLTSDALRGKKVIGLYFSADWCGPCRKFTPELVSFYKKMNQRRGKKDEFEIVWVSRCRDVNSYGQYFTHMGGWFALPPEEAMGQRGSMLSEKYKVKGIPTLVLLDDLGNVITTDGRNKIPQDKAGIGFPWRNPISTLYMTVLPRSLRLMIRLQVESVQNFLVDKSKLLFGQVTTGRRQQKTPSS